MIILTIVLGLIVLVSLTVTYQYFFHVSPLREARAVSTGDDPCKVGTALFLDSFSLLTNTTIFGENRIELLLNGEATYPRLFEDLRSARSLIAFQVFWTRPGRLSTELGDILAERARAGVTVLLLLDYFGAKPLLGEWADRLRQAGVEVAVFRPLKLANLYKVQQRTHIRSVTIDGKVGYTGGFGIDDHWMGDGRHEDQWRDTNVRVVGPSVDQIHAAFASNWLDATGQLLVGGRMFHTEDEVAGNVEESGILFAKPGLDSTPSERYYALTISSAHERLWITNSYFVPSQGFRKLLVEAARRGVDVRVLTPGRNTDKKSAYYAARRRYEELIEGGVQIFHYSPTMVHAKTIVADGVWSCIGSCNFDNRSMALNDETELVVQDAGFGARMEAVFERDIALSRRVTLEELRRRGLGSRIIEVAATWVAPLL